MPARLKSSHVVINCPFDPGYQPIFNAIVFAVYDLGFVARCALEEDDAADFRLSKIERMIEECRFGINDLSAVALNAATNLPRFNMPLELGLFFGCKRYGPKNQDFRLRLGEPALPEAARSLNATGDSRSISPPYAPRKDWNPTG